MKYHRIPDETVQRLPMYLRAFTLLGTEKVAYISSRQLADRLGLNPPQIRKDLSYFGAFGTRGVGYPVEHTARRIREILKLNTPQKAALIGAGRLGTALVAYPGFASFGMEIAAVFDKSARKVGRKVGRITIEDVSRLSQIGQRDIRLAILAVPSAAAQETAERLVAAGVRGILNLSPVHLKLPRQVKVIDIDLASQLGILPYYM